jgi:hypothetical protein
LEKTGYEELNNLCSSSSIIRITKSRRVWWAGHAARKGAKKNAHRIFVGKPEGKGPVERPRRRWVNNIKIDVIERGWGGVERIHLAQDRDQCRALVNTGKNLQVP